MVNDTQVNTALPLIPEKVAGLQDSRRGTKLRLRLQPRTQSRFKVRSTTVVPLDKEESILLSKESLLNVEEYVYHTPKRTSRNSTIDECRRPAAVSLDLLMMPQLSEAVSEAPIPKLVVNTKLIRRHEI